MPKVPTLVLAGAGALLLFAAPAAALPGFLPLPVTLPEPAPPGDGVAGAVEELGTHLDDPLGPEEAPPRTPERPAGPLRVSTRFLGDAAAPAVFIAAPGLPAVAVDLGLPEGLPDAFPFLQRATGTAPTTPRAMAVPAPTADELAGQAALLAPPAALAVGGVLRWLAAGGLGMYSRLTPSQVLQHPARRRILDHVRGHPGTSPSELQTLLGAGWGTVMHHLDRLEKNGHLRGERVGLSRRYFAVDTVAPAEREALGALRKPALHRLAEGVLASPGRRQGELAERLGLNRSAASKQFAELENVGLVRRERDGRTATVWPTDALAEAYDAVQKRPAAASQGDERAPALA